MSHYFAGCIQGLLLMAAVALPAAFPEQLEQQRFPATELTGSAPDFPSAPEGAEVQTEPPGLEPPSRYRAQAVVEDWLTDS